MEPKNLAHKVQRNFLRGDRVKTYFNEKWYSGEVFSRYFKEKTYKWESPHILIKTDEKVDDDPSAFLKGFGIEGRIDNLRTIFEWENEETMGDAMYHEEKTWEMSEEEKKEYNKPLPI